MSDDKSKIEVEKIVKHWTKTSDTDAQTMLILFKSKSYGWSLFLGHISVEKLLKALYVKKFEKHAPFTHNLYRLTDLVKIEPTEEQLSWLYQITAFNLNVRYDDYKEEFYKICTEDFTKEWIDKITILRKWIKQKL